MMTLLVTGGAGFIGGLFVRQARADGLRVVTLDKLTYAGDRDVQGDSPHHHFVQGDIADRALVARLLAELQPDAVVNFAAETHVDRSIDGPDAFIATNVVGTLALLEATIAHWRDLDEASRARFRFLHVSTDEVYGSLAPPQRADEAARYAPGSPYAASKAASDHLVRAFGRTYGLPVLTSNGANTYGPRQFPEKLIPRVIARALAGASIELYGDGRHVRDWLHVDDHCRALRRVLGAGRVGETFNIGAHAERENLRVVEGICALLDARRPLPAGRRYAAQIAFVADRPGHDRRHAVDAGKLRRELGWQPEVDFDCGLAGTVDWYLDNADWMQRALDGRYTLQRLGQG